MNFDKEFLLSVCSNLIATFVGGLLVALGNIINDCLIKPKKEFENLMGEVSYVLINESRYYSNPIKIEDVSGPRLMEYYRSSDEIRKIAVKLKVFSQFHKKSIYKVSSKNIYEAGCKLIGLSNSYFDDRLCLKNHEIVKEVEQLLNIKIK